MLDLIDAAGKTNNTINFSLINDFEKGKLFKIDDIKIMAPVRYPRRNFFCLGMNYADHAKEVVFTEKEKNLKFQNSRYTLVNLLIPLWKIKVLSPMMKS